MGLIMTKYLFLEKMSEKRSERAKQATRTRSVISFNHIDQRNLEKKDEFTKLFKFYHKLWFCHKRVWIQAKRLNLTLNLASVGLVTIGTVVGGVTLNPIVLGTILGAGILLKTALEMKNLQRKIDQSKLAFTAYQTVLSDLRNFMRGDEWRKEEFLMKLKTLDDLIIGMGLN